MNYHERPVLGAGVIFALAWFLLAPIVARSEVPEWQEDSRFRPWRVGATGLAQWQARVKERGTACLGFIVDWAPRRWPRISRHPIPWQSIQRLSRRKKIDWDRNVSFGLVRIDGGAPRDIILAGKDWSHILLEHTSASGKRLSTWVSRTTPALLFETNAASISFFIGKGVPQPKFCAFESEGQVLTKSLMDADELELPIEEVNWLLVWFGHAFNSSRFTPYVAYPAPSDCPILFYFENPPVSLSIKNGLTFRFMDGETAGRIAMIAPYGDNYPLALFDKAMMKEPHRLGWRHFPAQFRKYSIPDNSSTESWKSGIPQHVARTCRWWAERLHEVPVSVVETYSRDEKTDTVTVTESFTFERIQKGGTRFAPLPPMLALAVSQGFPVQLSGKMVPSSLLTAHGPLAGIEGTSSFEWRINGLSRYALLDRSPRGNGQVPPELLEELEAEVKRILDAGELAPWYPVLDDDGAGYMGYYDRGYRGYFVFGNPGETLYYLAEVYPLLKPATQKLVLAYLRDYRKKHPPERLGFLLPGQGAPRERYRPTPSYILARLNRNFRSANFYLQTKTIPAENLYYLARYYQLAGDKAELKELANDIFIDIMGPYLISLDWGTMGFTRHPVPWCGRAGAGGVIDINSFFAGVIGAIRLARMAGDSESENLFWGIFARTAALRFAMGKYHLYLYKSGLLRLPESPDWMMKLLACSWAGFLYSTQWKRPEDDVQQIWQMDQFGLLFREDRQAAWPGILTFVNSTPELGIFFKDFLRSETRALLRRVNEAMPAWWTVYCPCVQTWETNFQPPEDAHQLFLLEACALNTAPETLAWHHDVPWLKRGDLYYLHKLGEIIRAYRSHEEKPGQR